MFENRQAAGLLLANALKVLPESEYGWRNSVVIALPRGGVPVACEVALAYNCPLDVLVSKKIRCPDNPELAMGAVSSGGCTVLSEQGWFARQDYLQSQNRQKEELMKHTRVLEEHWVQAAGILSRPPVNGCRVILIDDGIATGMTVLAAIQDLKSRQVGQIVLAIPVVPADTYGRLRTVCNQVFALFIPKDFTSVGQWYRDFHQVEDAEVVASLRRVADRRLH